MHIPPQNLTSQILSDNPIAKSKVCKIQSRIFQCHLFNNRPMMECQGKSYESLKNKKKKGTYKTSIVEDFEISTIFSFYI